MQTETTATPTTQQQTKTQKLPEGWLETPNYGDLIPNTMFVPCKVPLSANKYKQQEEHHMFTVAKFVQEQKEQFQRSIGCMMDFTNTFAYYSQQHDVPSDVSYYKMMTKGHDVKIYFARLIIY